MNSERHPLEPFLPENARLLMLGSFPPKRIRWSMEFFYPNLQNDMWRIVGYLATGDKMHFLEPGGRRFDRERIEAFCRERGIALYDTAVEVIRLKDNASDASLQVVREVDLETLLARIPACRAVVTTGQKATDTLRAITGCGEPAVGECVPMPFAGRDLTLWRMPSSGNTHPRRLLRGMAQGLGRPAYGEGGLRGLTAGGPGISLGLLPRHSHEMTAHGPGPPTCAITSCA